MCSSDLEKAKERNGRTEDHGQNGGRRRWLCFGRAEKETNKEEEKEEIQKRRLGRRGLVYHE